MSQPNVPGMMTRAELASAILENEIEPVLGGSEIELYVFNETYESARAKHYHDLKTMSSYSEDYHIFQGTKEEDLIGAIRRGLDGSGVPVEFTKGEWGPGQQEINLRYC